MTSEIAIIVIMFIVKPATHMKKNVAMTEVGSASDVMSVERQSRMNTKTIDALFEQIEQNIKHMARVEKRLDAIDKDPNASMDRVVKTLRSLL